MTENHFPFEGEPDDVEQAPDGSNRKALLVVGGIVAALVALGGAYLLTSGGSDPVQSAFVPSARRVAPVAAPAAKPSAPAKLPKVFKDKLGRDPFRALYLAPAAAPAGAAAPGGAAPGAAAPGGAAPGAAAPAGGTTGLVTPVVVVPGPSTSPAPGVVAPPAYVPVVVRPTQPTMKEYSLVFKGVDAVKGKQYAVFTLDGRALRILAPKDPSKPTLFGPTQELGLVDIVQSTKGKPVVSVAVGESGFTLQVGQQAYVR